jgi:hypothetical protein
VTIPVNAPVPVGQTTVVQKLAAASSVSPPASSGNGTTTTITFTPNTANVWPGAGYVTVTYDDALRSRQVITAAQYAAALALLNQLGYTQASAPTPPGIPVENVQYANGVAITPAPVQTSAQPAQAPPTVPQNYMPVAVSPAGFPVNPVTGAPATMPAPAAAAGFDFNSIWTWLQGSMFGGIPNWILVAGGAALFLFSGSGGGKGHRRR